MKILFIGKSFSIFLKKDDNMIEKIQEEIRKGGKVAFTYSKKSSHTVHSKTYKKKSRCIECPPFNKILWIDAQSCVAHVEARVSMDMLVKKTLPLGLMPAVVTEFKEITVGGAIMGVAGESTSHRWGCFHDICLAYTLILGDGSLVRVTPLDQPDIFYGIPGSYGSLGLLVSAEIKLEPAKPFVHLKYEKFQDPKKALQRIKEESSDIFLDGILFSKELCVVIKGNFHEGPHTVKNQKWYSQHVKERKSDEEVMPLYDYLFRFDQGSFWMGKFLFSRSLVIKLLKEGIFKFSKSTLFTEKEVNEFRKIKDPNLFQRVFAYPIMKNKNLWKILHRAKKWVQERFMIQDFCIPKENAEEFMDIILQEPAIFPVWLCPIKKTREHLFTPNARNDLVNFGLYGVPSTSLGIEKITRDLEHITRELGGRKVLYGKSYYTEKEFWEIYSKADYLRLQEKTKTKGIFCDIIEKVLID